MNKDNEQEIIKIDIGLREFYQNLISIHANIKNFEDFSRVLSDKNESIRLCGSYKKVKIIQYLTNQIKEDKYFTIKNKGLISKEVEKIDTKLFKKLEKIKVPNVKELKTLEYVSSRIDGYFKSKDENRDNIIMELNRNARAVLQALQYFNDKKLIKKYTDKFNYIGSPKFQEIYYLRNYTNEVNSWPNIRQRLNYFSQRMYWMIHGGYRYKGLLTEFEDKEAYKKILRSDILRNIWTYQHQRAYLTNLIRMIKQGMEEKDWKDFEKFYNNLSKEQKKIGVDYGNKMISGMMGYLKKKYHEYPAVWNQQMSQMLVKLDSFEYQEKIIEQASKKLNEIFSRRLSSLEKQKDKALAKLKKETDNRIKEINILTGVKIPKEYLRIMNQEVKKLESKRKGMGRFVNNQINILHRLLGEILERAEPLVDRVYFDDKTPVIFQLLEMQKKFDEDLKGSRTGLVRSIYNLNGLNKTIKAQMQYIDYILDAPEYFSKNIQALIISLKNMREKIDGVYNKIFKNIGFIELQIQEPVKIQNAKQYTIGVKNGRQS